MFKTLQQKQDRKELQRQKEGAVGRHFMCELAGEFKKVKDEYLEHNLAATLASVGS